MIKRGIRKKVWTHLIERWRYKKRIKRKYKKFNTKDQGIAGEEDLVSYLIKKLHKKL